MLVKEAIAYGKVSTANTKMGTTSYAISTDYCQTGGKLKEVSGSACASCYAVRLEKIRPTVYKGWRDNFLKWREAVRTPEGTINWTEALAFQISRYNTDGYHRWFDAGDLYNATMLSQIIQVCILTPDIEHWLPTQELTVVNKVLDVVVKPDNLCIRVSDTMTGREQRRYANSSSVFNKKEIVNVPYDTVVCEASSRGNKCGPCKACWSTDVARIVYPKH